MIPAWLRLVLVLLLVGCTARDAAELEQRGEKVFLKGTNQAYTGKMVSHYQGNGDNRPVFQEGAYKMGLRHGKWVTHKWGGGHEEARYVLGKRHGRVTLYDRDGNILRESTYRNDRLHGGTMVWNAQGDLLSYQHYENGLAVPIPAGAAEEAGALEPPALKAFKRSIRDALGVGAD